MSSFGFGKPGTSSMPMRQTAETSRARYHRLVAGAFVADLVAITLALTIALWLRFETKLSEFGVTYSGEFSPVDYFQHIAVGVVLMMIILVDFRFYTRASLLSYTNTLRVIFKASLIWLLAYLALTLIFKFYPPVILPDSDLKSKRDPLGFVCLGRVVPEKEIERIIRILSALREKGYPVTLKLIGNLEDSEYSRHLAKVLEPHSAWVEPVGFLDLEKKQGILSKQTFAIHACRIEAFGIAVAEMASMGCVPMVPATGGAVEIVPQPEFQ
ncbi:glycosyltransferase [Verrucomicrobiales bacterium]|nr:glycosyltransferase [Verrucomicrobiales bacterium]